MRKRVISIVLACFACLQATVVSAYTPRLQVVLFNSAFEQLNFVQQQRFYSLTLSLYKTLNNEESFALLGHDKLRIASYMYLAEMWQSYSLEGVLAERGLTLEPIILQEIGVDEGLYRVPLHTIGPLNMAVSLSNIQRQCVRSTNNPYLFHYGDVLQNIDRLIEYLQKRSDGQASVAAMLYLKAYFYQRLHSSTSTHTFVNSDCISDLNGLLTCADGIVSRLSIDDAYLANIRQYVEFDLNNLMFNDHTAKFFEGCRIPMWYFIQSAALQEPLNDDEIVSSSNALLSSINSDIASRALQLDINSIIEDNKPIIEYTYKFRHSEDVNIRALRSAMLKQMRLGALRTGNLLNKEPVLIGASPQ